MESSKKIHVDKAAEPEEGSVKAPNLTPLYIYKIITLKTIFLRRKSQCLENPE
jgi:hypothetical protein